MTYRPYNILIQQAQSAGSSSIDYELENTSGFPIDELMPVTISALGGIKLINVASETDALNATGITKQPILNATVGSVAGLGRFIDADISFSFGAVLWVGKNGELTDVAPEVGVGGFVEGDFVIRVGKVLKNKDNPLRKDIIVEMQLIGQLG